MKKIIIILLIFFSLPFVITAKEEVKNWNKFGSSWEFKNSKVSTINSSPIHWGYYELTNFNSLLSLNDYNDYNSIEFDLEIFDRDKTPSEVLISFNITSESQSWLYHMYAFKLTGDYWNIDKVSFVFSDRLDKTKPFNTKNNTFIKELASVDYKIKYGKMNKYRILFEGINVVLYVNDEKVLSAPFPEKNPNGRIAVSARNVKIAIDKIVVKKENQIVFEDDFNTDTILIKKLKAERVPSEDIEKNEIKKQK